jgi:hypothetical protein
LPTDVQQYNYATYKRSHCTTSFTASVSYRTRHCLTEFPLSLSLSPRHLLCSTTPPALRTNSTSPTIFESYTNLRFAAHTNLLLPQNSQKHLPRDQTQPTQETMTTSTNLTLFPRSPSSTTPASPTSTYIWKSPPNIGPISLPWLIILILFGPFAISLVWFVLWRYGIKRHQDRKRLEQEEGRKKEMEEGIEMQIKGLVGERRVFV